MLLSTTAIVLIVIVTIEVARHGKRVHHFCFLDSQTPFETNFSSRDQPRRGRFVCRNRRSSGSGGNTISNGRNDIFKIESPWWAFQVFGSSTSLTFLALISLERVYSVLWPFRHRVTSTRAYVYSIVIVWVIGVCMSGVWLVTIYHNDKLYASLTYSSAVFISLLVICASYLTIRSRLQSTVHDRDLDVRRHASMEKTLRMSRTFFIVIAVSLVFWLPAFVMFLFFFFYLFIFFLFFF